MLNCGGIFNLEDYIDLSEEVTIYILDSHRPVNLRNAFWNNEIIVFHETDLDKDLVAEKEAILFTEVEKQDMFSQQGKGSNNSFYYGTILTSFTTVCLLRKMNISLGMTMRTIARTEKIRIETTMTMMTMMATIDDRGDEQDWIPRSLLAR